tara:strand:+ start:130 stop:495 length:366 start_codon:yes stop_codon:yes gene_type:complete
LDGYRCKRWNGSSEDYGMRWNQGDVVGCLLDLDSMQMKFYLNGEDLGNDGDGGRWWLQWTVVVPMTDDVYLSFLLSFFPSFLPSFLLSFLFFIFFQGWPTVIFMKVVVVVVVACIPPSVST